MESYGCLWIIVSEMPSIIFSLPFITLLLEKFDGYGHYYFMDGYADLTQILIALEYIQKTIFISP